MLLTLSILTYRNQPAPHVAPGRFSDTGGALGRAPDNVLVLDDPGKYISRTHARVAFRAGGYFLEDVGSNPSVINDRPLGKGREIMLADGDRIVIGDYQLEARIVAQAPVASLLAPVPFNDTALPLFEPPPAPAPVQLPPLELVPATPVEPAFGAGRFDALAGARILDIGPADGAGAAFDDPLGLNLFGAAPVAPPAVPVPGDLGFDLAPQCRAAESDHVSPELVPFRLPAAGAPPGMPMAPPFAFQALATPAARPAAAFAIPDDYDPLADFFPRAAASAPAAHVAPAAPPVHQPEFDVPPAPVPIVVGPVTVLPPAAAIPDSMGEAQMSPAPAAPLPPAVPPPPVPPAAPPIPAPAVAVAPSASAPPASDSAVLQALLRGLGLPDLQLNRSGVQVAETVGALLRVATTGTMEVLMARALTKKESRIDMTMISVSANNPLKFFPNPDSALTQMLTNTMAGYLPPVEAMHSAFNDLKAHELAVIAGMRAALAAVLHRFDPAQIESRLAVPSVMDKMMGSHRKAKMWDRLVELYGEIAREADDDLQRLFGEKFSQAYEEQVERLHRAGK